jgi:hypothetical protein
MRAAAVTALVAVLAAGTARAVRQTPSDAPERKPEAVVTWSLTAPPSVVHGQRFDATVKAGLKPGWRFYALEQSAAGPRPLRLSVADLAFAIVGTVTPDRAPIVEKDTVWSALVAFHDRPTEFRVPLRPADGTTGNSRLRLTVRYQACSEELCLRPTLTTLDAPVAVSP